MLSRKNLMYGSIQDSNLSTDVTKRLILGEGSTSHMMFRALDVFAKFAGYAKESTWVFLDLGMCVSVNFVFVSTSPYGHLWFKFFIHLAHKSFVKLE